MSKQVLVLYGSQTGTAESIAKLIADDYAPHVGSRCFSMLDFVKANPDLSRLKGAIVLFVCSTTGDGDAPGNAEKFMSVMSFNNSLRPATVPPQDNSSNSQYQPQTPPCQSSSASTIIEDPTTGSVPPNWLGETKVLLLGLGSSDYSKFCGAPKRLETLLRDAGAEFLSEPCFADDAVGIERFVEPWRQGLGVILAKATQPSELKTAPRSDVIVQTAKQNYSKFREKAEVKTRFFLFKEYKDCFVGKEVVINIP
jgi:methionine synthase reductase